jgi:DNA-binding GntR family transcriptional regulator
MDDVGEIGLFQGGLGEALYARVKAEITSLRLPPGTQVQEAALGERFGVSRTPAREVLQRLQRDGLVERAGRFWRVIRLPEHEVRELCEVREALECMAVQLAAQRDPELPAVLAPLVDAQDAALERRDYDLSGEIDTLFHLRIAERAGNGELMRHLGRLHDRIALVRGMEQRRPHWRRRLIAEHWRIVNALERGNADIAVAEMRYHIRSVILLRPAGWQAVPDQGEAA